jgi:4-hydroxybenzoate polyprenyltransferase
MILSRVKHWFSMSDPKYLPIMVLPFVVSYIAGGQYNISLLLIGCFLVILLNTAAVLINMYCDRRADEINFPQGVQATEQFIGYHQVLVCAVICVIALIAASLAVFHFVSWRLSVLYTVGWLIAINYSAGLRLKRSLLLGRLCIACGPSFSLAAGCSFSDQVAAMWPLLLLMAVAQAIHILIKDVPDADGDLRAGVRTMFNGMPRSRLKVALPLLWCIPYVLTTGLMASGFLSGYFSVIWVLYPWSLLVIYASLEAQDQKSKELVREFAQVYSTVFIVLLLVLAWPNQVTALISVFALAYYFLLLSARIDRRRQGHGLVALLSFVRNTARSAFSSFQPQHKTATAT